MTDPLKWLPIGVFVLAVGCYGFDKDQTSSDKIQAVKLGMDKPAVKAKLGVPDNKKLMAIHRKNGDSLIVWFYEDKYAIHFYGAEARTIITDLLEHRKLMKQYVEARQADQEARADSLMEASEAYVKKMKPAEVSE